MLLVAMAGFPGADSCKATYGDGNLIFRLATGSLFSCLNKKKTVFLSKGKQSF